MSKVESGELCKPETIKDEVCVAVDEPMDNIIILRAADYEIPVPTILKET